MILECCKEFAIADAAIAVFIEELDESLEFMDFKEEADTLECFIEFPELQLAITVAIEGLEHGSIINWHMVSSIPEP